MPRKMRDWFPLSITIKHSIVVHLEIVKETFQLKVSLNVFNVLGGGDHITKWYENVNQKHITKGTPRLILQQYRAIIAYHFSICSCAPLHIHKTTFDQITVELLFFGLFRCTCEPSQLFWNEWLQEKLSLILNTKSLSLSKKHNWYQAFFYRISASTSPGSGNNIKNTQTSDSQQ